MESNITLIPCSYCGAPLARHATTCPYYGTDNVGNYSLNVKESMSLASKLFYDQKNKSLQQQQYKVEGKPTKTEGPGTELKKVLAKIKIVATDDCACNRRMQEMNDWGIDGCERNLQSIIQWLMDEAEARGWVSNFKTVAGFEKFGMHYAAKFLIKKAIKNYKKKVASTIVE